ncbi:MAG: hypothetical protein JNL90_20190 [Planctomycetes bacterium]|nr:hypothetical protein [Planctomycetota bacterium]
MLRLLSCALARPRSCSRTLLAGGATALLATAAAAQGVYYGPSELCGYGGAIARQAGFGRCEPCHLDADRAVDLAALRGTTLFATLAPEYLRGATLVVHEAARDFAVVPDGNGGDGDALLIATDEGVYVATLPLVGETFDLALLLEASDARRLRVADFDLDGDRELFVLHGDGSIDVRELTDGARVARFEAPLLCDDFVVLRFDPSAATAQVAARHPDGMTLLSADGGEPLLELRDAPDFSLLATVRAADGREALARVVQYALAGEPYPHQWLTTHWLEGSEAPLDLGFVECSSLVPADLEGDGDDDLMVGIHWSYDAFLLVNGGSGAPPAGGGPASFGAFVVTPLGVPGPAHDNDAWPALADLDGDGDLDLFMNLESIDGYMTMKSPIAGDEAQLALLPEPSTFLAVEDGSWKLELVLHAPQRYHPGCDALEIAWWRQPTLAAPLEPGALGRMVIPMPAFDATGRAQVTIPFAEGGWMEAIHHFAVRAVEVEAGAIVHAVSAATFAFTTDLATRESLVSEMGNNGWVEVAVEEGGKGPRRASCGGTLGGGIICFPSLFSFGGHRP